MNILPQQIFILHTNRPEKILNSEIIAIQIVSNTEHDDNTRSPVKC